MDVGPLNVCGLCGVRFSVPDVPGMMCEPCRAACDKYEATLVAKAAERVREALTNPADACRFVKHEVTEDEARAVLGDGFQDLYKRGAFDDGGTVTITSVDMGAGVLTFDRDPRKVTASPGPDDYIFRAAAPEEPPSPDRDATMNRHERRRRDALARRGKR